MWRCPSLLRPQRMSRQPNSSINIMASDEYSVVGGGGALKLKGAKVHKKKKKRDKSDLEKNIGKEVAKKGNAAEDKAKDKADEEDEDDRPVVQKTESEKRHEEIKRKRVSRLFVPARHPSATNHVSCSSFSWQNPPAPDLNCSRRTRSEWRNSTPTSPG